MSHTAGLYFWFLQNEATESIATPPRWNASPSQVTPSITLLVPIYTPRWRETMWGKVAYLRTLHDGREALNNGPSDR